MTLDEAIKYHEDMAEVNECAAKMLSDDAFLHMDSEYKNECRDNASKSAVACKEHRQLVDWLSDLKQAKLLLRKVQNEMLKGASCDPTSFLDKYGELMDKLTEGVEDLDGYVYE